MCCWIKVYKTLFAKILRYVSFLSYQHLIGFLWPIMESLIKQPIKAIISSIMKLIVSNQIYIAVYLLNYYQYGSTKLWNSLCILHPLCQDNKPLY